MALTIAQANAINDVLRWMLRDFEPGQDVEVARRAGESAEYLAAAAHDKLGAGLTAENVRRGWGMNR